MLRLLGVCLLACGAWADPITFVRPGRQLEAAAAVKDAGSSMRFRATTTVAKAATKSGATVASTTAAAAGVNVAVAATVASKTGGLLNATCTRVYPTFCTMVRPLSGRDRFRFTSLFPFLLTFRLRGFPMREWLWSWGTLCVGWGVI